MANSSNSSSALEVKNVSVMYRSYENRPTSLKENLLAFLRSGKMKYYSTFEALSNVSFSVPKGTVFGIIGSNGAGKSTLLKVLAGVLPPTSGEIIAHGSVDSLIQLGAGFDPDLTARENIFLYASLHGKKRKEIEKSVDRILEFAELVEFSHTPIKYFSAGMSARLGFSCAIDVDPDILLVDEVLQVGDERFGVKCREVFRNFIAKGKTVVMVSHALDQLAKEADTIMVLSKGQIIFTGEPDHALEVYRDPSYQTRLTSEAREEPESAPAEQQAAQ